MSVRAIIVEDRASARNVLRKLLLRHPDVAVLGEYEDTASAWPVIEDPATRLDVVFLDIDIQTEGERAGMELAHRISRLKLPQKLGIVFTTAYEAPALEAHDVQPVGYLLKPIDDAKVCKVLDKIRLDQPRDLPIVPPLIEIKHRTLQHGETVWCTRLVGLSEILYIQSDDATVKVHLRSDEVLEGVHRPLKNWHEADFMRVHNSYVANFSWVNGYKTNPFSVEGYKATFSGSAKDIPIGKTFEDRFFSALAQKAQKNSGG
ncbi:MAG: response regulator transcription factor [Methylococcaceae bacterium]|nr:response regulator transcription factor [Methylococcaceae bacterium]